MQAHEPHWFQPRWWWFWYCLGCVILGAWLGEHVPRRPRLPAPLVLPARPCDDTWPCTF